MAGSGQNVLVTVFTPTYNRDRYIMRLAESLCRQTKLSLEWVVVDQGSDRTEELVRAFAEQAPFRVIYHRLEGERGISRALNAMLELASGLLVLKVDDDDTLTPDAIETVIAMEGTLEDKERYAGVSGLRQYPDGTIIGGGWQHPTEWIDCTNLQRNQYGLYGDKAEAYYLSVLREYGPMPTVPGEYYTWESVLWDHIAHAGKLIRWFNKKIYITEYLPDGATDGERRARLTNFFTYTVMVARRMTYREIPWRTRLIYLCRYFELLRLKRLPFSAVKTYFRDSLPLARLAYACSAVTRLIPGRGGTVKIQGEPQSQS